jgi:hypothetical protein
MLGYRWDALPADVKPNLIKCVVSSTLKEQTLMNVLYGLAHMNVNWDALDPLFRDSIVTALESEATFGGTLVPQHCSNSIWVGENLRIFLCKLSNSCLFCRALQS